MISALVANHSVSCPRSNIMDFFPSYKLSFNARKLGENFAKVCHLRQHGTRLTRARQEVYSITCLSCVAIRPLSLIISTMRMEARMRREEIFPAGCKGSGLIIERRSRLSQSMSRGEILRRKSPANLFDGVCEADFRFARGREPILTWWPENQGAALSSALPPSTRFISHGRLHAFVKR